MGASASLAIQGASFLSTASNQYSQGKDVRAAGNYSSSVYNQNATLADQQAADAITRGDTAASRQEQATSGLIGAERTGYAGQGVDVNSGSAADVQTDSARLGALDALTIRNNARREAFGYGVQAAQDRTQGAFAKASGDNQANALDAGAVSTLLTGGATLTNLYQKNHPTIGTTTSPTVPVSTPVPYKGKGYVG